MTSRVAVVTGASNGIGLGIATALFTRGFAVSAALAILLVTAPGRATTPEGASTLARAALASCHRASLVEPGAASARLESGLALAERASESSPDDPVAHFALFCNLAKRIRLRGLGLATLIDLARARAALDRSLALDPGYADALAAKGALLYYSPRFAGGDVAAAERLIRSALTLDPDNPTRLVLVDLLVHRDAIDEARGEAERSIVALRATPDLEARAGARSLLEHLCARAWPSAVGVVMDGACQASSITTGSSG